MSAWLKLDPKDIFAFAVSALIGFFAGSLVPDPAWSIYTAILISYHIFLVWLVVSGDQQAGLSLPIGHTIMTHVCCVFVVVALGFGRHHIPFFGFFRYGIVAIAIFERGWLFSTSSNAPKYEGPIDLLKPRTPRGIVQTTSTLAGPQAQIPTYTPSAPSAAAPAQPVPAAAPPASLAPQFQPIFTGQASPAAAAAGQPQTNKKQGQMVPVMVFDNSIAKSIRRKPAAGEADTAPILQATAQDHEDWLRERARSNPTDRKPGVTVREEYEQWLKARFKARAAQMARGARAAAQ